MPTIFAFHTMQSTFAFNSPNIYFMFQTPEDKYYHLHFMGEETDD